MSPPAVAAIILIACCLLQLAGIAAATRDDDDQADTPDTSHPGPTEGQQCSPAGQTGPLGPGWLPATLPDTPRHTPPWLPRVCAGRVATLQAVVTVCTPAGWPVASYHAGVCWPAQEVTA